MIFGVDMSIISRTKTCAGLFYLKFAHVGGLWVSMLDIFAAPERSSTQFLGNIWEHPLKQGGKLRLNGRNNT